MRTRNFRFKFRQIRNTVLASCLALLSLNADAQVTQVASGIAATSGTNNFIATSVSPAGDFVGAWKFGDNLTVASWTGSAWSSNVISSSTAIGSTWNFSDDVDIKVASDGIYHVVLRAINNNVPCCAQERGIFYTTFNPTNNTWGTFQKVQSYADAGGSENADNPSLALDQSNNPEIVWEYSFSGTPRLKEFRHAVKTSSSWTITSLAGTSGSGHGDVTSPKIVINAAGDRVVSYMSNTTEITREDYLLAYVYSGGAWVKDTIEPADGVRNYGDPNDVALIGSNPVVAYAANGSSGVSNDVKFAKFNGTTWITENVVVDCGVGAKPSIATNSAGHIAIAYIAKNTTTSKNEIRVAYYNGTQWLNELIYADGVTNMGGYFDFSLNDDDEFMAVFHNQVTSSQRDVRYVTGAIDFGISGGGNTNTAPTISAQGFSIDENSAATTAVGTVSASDDDNDPLTFSITAGNTGGAFAIDASTGELTVAGALDYETLDSYALTVQAHDGTDSTSATVTVTINDLAEAAVNILASNVAANTTWTSSISTVLSPTGDYVAAWHDGSSITIGKWTGSAWSMNSVSVNTAIASGWGFQDIVDVKIGTDGIHHVVLGAQNNNQACCSQERGIWYGAFNPTNSSWSFSKVQSYSDPNGYKSGTNPSIALDAANNPEIVWQYSDVNTPRLKEFRHAVKNGSAWTINSYASTSGNGHGDVTSPRIAIDANGKRTISYMSNTTQTAKNDFMLTLSDASGSWVKDTIIAADGTYNRGEHSDMVIVNGKPAVIYGTNDNGSDYGVGYAAYDGSNWVNQTVKAGDPNGLYYVPNIAANASGHMVATFIQINLSSYTNELWMSYYDGTQWQSQKLHGDANQSVGYYNDISLNDNDEFMLVFYNDSAGIRQIRYLQGSVNFGTSSAVVNTAPTIGAQGFSIDENSAATTAVGTVSASDDDNDPLTFSITAGNTGGAFAIDANTGAITVAGALDYETLDSYALTVQAHDGTDSTSATVTITINDILEALPTVLAAWDGGSNSGVQGPFAVTSSNAANAATTLNVTVVMPNITLNWYSDAQGMHYLNGGFTNAADSLSWNTQVSTKRFSDIKVSSKQRNSGESGTPAEFKLQYSLDGSTWIDVVSTINVSQSDWTTGTISGVALPSACNNKDAVYLRWLMKSNATNNNQPNQNSGYSFIDDIEVVGVAIPNTAPVIGDASFTIDEDASLSLLSAIYADYPSYLIDADNDTMQQIVFPTLPTQGTLTVSGVAAVAGQAYGRSNIQYTPAANYSGVDSLTFNISDGTDFAAAPATIHITINAVNDAPAVSDVYATTDEDVAVNPFGGASISTYSDVEGTAATKVKITSLPTHGTLTLLSNAIVVGAEVNLGDMGDLLYTPAANFNGSDSFTWNASDGTDYADSDATVYITVNATNDAPTGIVSSVATVNENSAIGTPVTTLSAVDADAGDSHVYQLVAGAGDSGNGYFSISGDQLLVASGIDYERTTQLSVRVQVIDAQGMSIQESFDIQVLDQNDAPRSITLSNNTVSEQQLIGSFVGSFATGDEDVNDTHTLALVSGAGDSGNGSFSIVNNVLTTAATFDYNTQQQYSIRVSSTDAANASIEEVFVINVTDVNQAPTDIAITGASIAENNAIGAFIGVFSATDADANDVHTFALVSGLGDDDNASFDLTNGVLSAAESFDFETRDSYSIRVQATDNDGATTEKIFTISVIDGTDAPSAVSLSSNTVNENVTIGTLIGSFSTLDVDQSSGHTYSFATGAGDTDNGSFQISNGTLLTASPLDFETKNSYSIRVRSTDNGGAFAEETFTITVSDLNEAPTGVTINIIGIDENSPIGTAVGNLNATDVDVNSLHTFTLVAGPGAADNGKFSIQANKLQVNALLDYETQANYSVRIRATDNGGAFAEQSFTVTITDVNEAPTGLTLSATSINENEAAGSSIGTFSISDQDGGDSHGFTLVSGAGDTDNGMFYISGNTLVANASFNFEQQSSYSIRVAGTDLGGLKEEGMFIITINNVADAPVVTDLFKTVYKNQNTGFTSREFYRAFSQEEGNTQQYIRIDVLPANGQLMFINTPIAVGQTILVAEFSNLSYMPNGNYLGTDAFEFSAFDGVMYSATATYALNVVNPRVVGGAVNGTLTNGSIISLNPGSFGNPGVAREGDFTSIEEMPLEVTTFGNYPNPFQGITNISFELSGTMEVTLEVYDLLGRKVASLVNGEALNGKQVVQWNGGEANGQYIARLSATAADGTVITKTISLVQTK